MTVVYGKMRKADDYYITKAYHLAFEWNSLPVECSMSNWFVPGTIEP